MNGDLESGYFITYFVLNFTQHAQSAIIITVNLAKESIYIYSCVTFILLYIVCVENAAKLSFNPTRSKRRWTEYFLLHYVKKVEAVNGWR